jgi:hypothetical protein
MSASAEDPFGTDPFGTDPFDAAPRPPRPDARAVRGSFVGMGGMACVLFLILASVPFTPWWVVAALGVGWLVLLVQGSRWFMTRPRSVALLPVWLLLAWVVTVVGGAALFGWAG